MSHTQHTSFLDLADADFKTYSEALVLARETGAERQAAFTYLQQVLSKDENLVETRQTSVLSKKISAKG